MTLLLWDIDGTLLNARGAGRDSMLQAARDVFGVDVDWARIDHVGRTDSFICRCMAENHGVAFGNGQMRAFMQRYELLLAERLRAVPAEPLPGIRELLEAAHARSDVKQGLLTGNFKDAAFIKLRHFGLDRYFDFGAFGDEHESRDELARMAVERAESHPGWRSGRAIVIGDTPHDAACGRAVGARVVLVATGVRDDVEALRPFGPDLLVPDFSRFAGRVDLLWTLEGVDPPVPVAQR